MTERIKKWRKASFWIIRGAILFTVLLAFLPLGAIDHPTDKAAEYKSYGDYYLQVGDIQTAILNYKIALIYGTEYWPAHQALGTTYYRLGDYQRARKHFRKAYVKSGQQEDLKILLAQLDEMVPPVTSKDGDRDFKIDRVVIEKSSYTLKLYDDRNIVRKIYHIAVGKNPDGADKQGTGDKRTPEGTFIIDRKSHFEEGSWGRRVYGPYYFSLRSDIWGGIGIHGTYKNKSIGTKASLGCVRLYAKDIIELAKYIDIGTVVHIKN